MTARADTSVWLDDDVPIVRVNRLNPSAGDPAPRAIVSIGDVLGIFGPTAILRATLTAALAALDGLDTTEAGQPS